VFQNFALFPHLTVRKNVEYGLMVQNVNESERTQRVEQLLNLVNLSGMSERVPGELSGGQQQRVALARALAPEPDVLLLDEPLSSLDKKLRESMQVELRRLHRELDITTLLVTHNQREALTMSDRIAIMRGGHIEQIGTPQEVYQSPRSRFVADFIGTANMLNGTVTKTNGHIVFTDEQGFSLTLKDGAIPEIDTDQDEVTAVVRPEDVSLSLQNGASGEAEDMTGTVEFRRYLGSEFEYHVESTHHDRTVVATEPVTEKDLSEGDKVRVDIDSENVVVVTN
jgi:ABC-type Fe3+/spermidine/putrescine transport system ATPase subunit